MPTEIPLVLYVDVRIASRGNHGREDGKSSQATCAGWAIAIERQDACGSSQDGWSTAANGVSLARRVAGTRNRRFVRNEQGRAALADVSRAGYRTAESVKRVCHRPLDTQARAPPDPEVVQYQIQRRECLAHPWRTGLFEPEAGETCARAQRRNRWTLEEALAWVQKKPSERAA